MKLMNILLEKTYQYNDLTVRSMAWLYLIHIPYKGTINIDSWKSDKRMGISFLDGVDYLIKMNYVYKDDDKIKTRNKEYIDSILLNFFMVNINNSIQYYKRFNFFKKYDTKNYDISGIPLDLYQNISVKKKEELSSTTHIENDIKWWYLKTWQNNQHLNIPYKYYKYCGLPNLVNQNKVYRLYRGISINLDNKENINLKIGKNIMFNDKKSSWSLSFNIAKKFAFDNSVYFNNKIIKKNTVGIILTNVFNKEEILIDTEYVRGYDNYFSGGSKFSEECEVLVKPKKREVKIFLVYTEGEKA